MAEIYTTQCKMHRSNITAVDASDPADTSGAVNTAGYKECRFDITDSQAGLSAAKKRVLGLVLVYNSRRGEYEERLSLSAV